MRNDMSVPGNLCKRLIAIATMGARGKEGRPLPEIDATLLNIASEQKVLPLVACAMLHGEEEAYSPDVRECCLDALRNSASANMVRRQRILQLIQEMESAGFQVCMLKGLSIARLYAYPESREAIDTDLLIDPKQEKKIYAFLQEKGFTVKGRRATANDGVCTHPKYGKIEIHTNLYPELTQRAWKDFVASKDLQSEPWIRVYEPDGSFNTLGHTDQLIFLTLHMVKHFVESGLSIRMMLDTALHFSRFYQEIDVQRFWRVMRSLRCDGCVSVILWIMIRCGGFRAEDFPGIVEAAPESMDGILRDLETGGYMGAKAMQERHESGMEYYRRMLMKNKSTLQYWCYMLSWKVRSGSSNMFPSYQRLKAMYPCIEYNPCIAPAVWVFQMVLYPVSKIRTGVLRRDIRSERSVISSESEQRVALFEKLGMF